MKLTRVLPSTLQVVLLVISTDPWWHNFANSKTVPDVTVFIKSFTCLICLVNLSRSLCYVAKAVACRCTEALSLQLFTHILVGTTLQIQKLIQMWQYSCLPRLTKLHVQIPLICWKSSCMLSPNCAKVHWLQRQLRNFYPRAPPTTVQCILASTPSYISEHVHRISICIGNVQFVGVCPCFAGALIEFSM